MVRRDRSSRGARRRHSAGAPPKSTGVAKGEDRHLNAQEKRGGGERLGVRQRQYAMTRDARVGARRSASGGLPHMCVCTLWYPLLTYMRR